jgi:hypothetical protein
VRARPENIVVQQTARETRAIFRRSLRLALTGRRFDITYFCSDGHGPEVQEVQERTWFAKLVRLERRQDYWTDAKLGL